MSFTLVSADQGKDARHLDVNAWNWGTIHYFVTAFEVLPENAWAPCRYNSGTVLVKDQVKTLIKFLENDVLPRVKPGERILVNGQTTSEADNGTFYRDENDAWKNYSLEHDVLVNIIAFLKETDGAIKVC